MVASFAGSLDYTSATSNSVTFTISQATPTVSVVDGGGIFSGSAFPATALVNGAASLEGVTPTLAYYAGNAATGSPLAAAPSAAGIYTLVASFAGSTDYTAATSSNVTFTIAQATPTVNVSDAGGTYDGSSVFPATALVNGSATLESVGTTLAYYAGTAATGSPLAGALDAAGTYTVVANFAGSPDYASASSSLTFTIAQATPTVNVSDSGGTYDGTSSFPATALVNGSADAGVDRHDVGLLCRRYGQRLAAVWRTSAAGIYTAVASFTGSPDYAGASGSVTFTIARATPTVTVTDAGGTYNSSTFPAAALVNGSSTLESIGTTLVYYAGATASGSPLPGAPSAAGTYTVVANFAGSADYASANSANVTFSITKATPTVTVGDAGGTYQGSAFPATALVNGSATLESVGTTLAYYAGSTASGSPLTGAPSAAGTYTVVASFPGSARLYQRGVVEYDVHHCPRNANDHR